MSWVSGGVIPRDVKIDNKTLIKDEITGEIKVNVDNKTLVYDDTSANVKVNIDNDSVIYDDKSAKVKTTSVFNRYTYTESNEYTATSNAVIFNRSINQLAGYAISSDEIILALKVQYETKCAGTSGIVKFINLAFQDASKYYMPITYFQGSVVNNTTYITIEHDVPNFSALGYIGYSSGRIIFPTQYSCTSVYSLSGTGGKGGFFNITPNTYLKIITDLNGQSDTLYVRNISVNIYTLRKVV